MTRPGAWRSAAFIREKLASRLGKPRGFRSPSPIPWELPRRRPWMNCTFCARRLIGIGTEVPRRRALRVGVMRPPFDPTRRIGVKFSDRGSPRAGLRIDREALCGAGNLQIDSPGSYRVADVVWARVRGCREVIRAWQPPRNRHEVQICSRSAGLLARGVDLGISRTRNALELAHQVHRVEGVPVLDMTRVYPFVKEHGSRLLGPNCPGLISPGASNVGIIPGRICTQAFTDSPHFTSGTAITATSATSGCARSASSTSHE